MMQIGFFGGSFDPPHAGHLAVAEAAVAGFALDQVLLAPVALQPLKNRAGHAGYEDRLRMVTLLCQESPRLRASDLDAPRADGAPNYTVDTLETLQGCYPDARLFCIAGIDSFATFGQWHRPDRLLERAEWIVVSRPGNSFDQLSGLELTERQRARVHPLASVDVPVSATDVRARLAKGEPCEQLVPPQVLAYIREHHLYRH